MVINDHNHYNTVHDRDGMRTDCSKTSFIALSLHRACEMPDS